MQNTNPEVSVIVPTRNNEKFIVHCLDSVLTNNPTRIELLIIDDGSMDSSVQIINDWKNKREKQFHRVTFVAQKNLGITATLNKLVRMSTGKYVVVLAGDDYLLPNGIDKRICALEHNPEWLAVFGDCEVVDENGNKLLESGIELLYPKRSSARKSALKNKRTMVLELILRWSIPGPVFLARREAYSPETGVGIYDEALKAEDRDFYLRLLAKNALGFIDASVAAYRWHGTSVVRDPIRRNQVQFSVIEAEKKNLHLFEGIEHMALFVVGAYKSGVHSFRTGGSVVRKVMGFLQAIIFRVLWLFAEYYQRIRVLILSKKDGECLEN